MKEKYIYSGAVILLFLFPLLLIGWSESTKNKGQRDFNSTAENPQVIQVPGSEWVKANRNVLLRISEDLNEPDYKCLVSGYGLATGIILKTTFPNHQQSLTGLEKFAVNILIPEGAEKYGITKQLLQKEIETKLHKYGIKVISFNEYSKREYGSSAGVLQFTADFHVPTKESSIKNAATLIAKLEVLQDVILARKITMADNASTWISQGTIGIVNLDALQDVVKKEAEEATDEFIKVYFAVNEKEINKKIDSGINK